jgi:hypothetical protein
MVSWRDRFNKISGKTRFLVSRIFVHLAGNEVATILGVLNRAAREAIDSEGDISRAGEGLVDICQTLLQMNLDWRSAANEGDVIWDEGEASDYFTYLFTDSAQRYLSEVALEDTDDDEDELSVPITTNVVVMITIAAEGEVPALETSLAEVEALEDGLKALIDLHYQGRLRALQVHFSPAQLGDELTDEQILMNFAELVPL